MSSEVIFNFKSILRVLKHNKFKEFAYFCLIRNKFDTDFKFGDLKAVTTPEICATRIDIMAISHEDESRCD